jgi:hypothetical protein
LPDALGRVLGTKSAQVYRNLRGHPGISEINDYVMEFRLAAAFKADRTADRPYDNVCGIKFDWFTHLDLAFCARARLFHCDCTRLSQYFLS